MLSRRELLDLAWRASALGVIAHAAPLPAWAQVPRVAAGKEKLIIRSVRPPDYEAPVALLDSWITPVEHFYVRQHMPMPAGLDAATWTLQIEVEVDAPVTLTLDE